MITIKGFPLILILLFCGFVSLSAQSIVPELKWSIFTAEDLKMKEWAEDTSATTVILGNVGAVKLEEMIVLKKITK